MIKEIGNQHKIQLDWPFSNPISLMPAIGMYFSHKTLWEAMMLAGETGKLLGRKKKSIKERKWMKGRRNL